MLSQAQQRTMDLSESKQHPFWGIIAFPNSVDEERRGPFAVNCTFFFLYFPPGLWQGTINRRSMGCPAASFSSRRSSPLAAPRAELGPSPFCDLNILCGAKMVQDRSNILGSVSRLSEELGSLGRSVVG